MKNIIQDTIAKINEKIAYLNFIFSLLDFSARYNSIVNRIVGMNNK
jgi:hypothetical protein